MCVEAVIVVHISIIFVSAHLTHTYLFLWAYSSSILAPMVDINLHRHTRDSSYVVREEGGERKCVCGREGYDSSERCDTKRYELGREE